ncbi:MAG: amidase [Acidobacteria bacterium]|nr:MAG: amidase [Acidobacteriota bacterium]
MIGEDVLFSSVRDLGQMLRTRKISSVDLTEAYLSRLETVGPRLGAVVTVTRELALSQARKADRELAIPRRYRGPLHGIPFGAKDLLATRGIPTTWGAEPYRNQVFDYDASVVERLREAGAVLLGKLAMVELAGGMGYNNPDASFTGPGRTPWNPDHWSGGSSSGSGAATAAGCVAFAIGSETSGSIMTPATHCGLSGLRPTYGLVSRHGAMALCWTLDKLGPLCRTADDCGLVLAAIAGKDPKDPTTGEGSFEYPTRGARAVGPSRRFRLGVLKNATERAQPEVKENFRRSLDVLRSFARLDEDVEFPDFPWGPAVGIIVDAEGASAFRDLIESGGTRKLKAQADRVGGYSAVMTLAVDYLEAMRARVPMRAALDGLLSRYDALVAPTRLAVAPPIGYDFDKPPGPSPTPSPTPSPSPDRPSAPATIPAGNLAGVPALCVPNGFGQHGLPTSLQLIGRAFSESTLLAIADRYQQATDWHTKRPPALG